MAETASLELFSISLSGIFSLLRSEYFRREWSTSAWPARYNGRMDQATLHQLARQLINGQIDADRFVTLASQPTSVDRQDEHSLSIDLDRRERCGFPEVIYGQGKSPEAIHAAIGSLVDRGEAVLVTRLSLSAEQLEKLSESFPSGKYNKVARTFRLGAASSDNQQNCTGQVAVITAGTTDAPVAEEAHETLEWMGVGANMIHDVGVAGPHRLPARLAEFETADALVVVAGMEGALPSIVGGYVACPVIAVPTSVGYGANFGGLSALLGMLNSCSSNVAVVNIDAGFKGGYLAGMIAKRCHARSD